MTDGAAAQTREPLKNGGTRNLANPLWCFHGFRLCVIILTIFGVIMVFSSSSVNMIANGQSPWAQALKQGMYCVFGLVIAFITMMLPASFYRKISFWFLLGAMVMQAATLTPLGVEVNGNKGWIGIPGVFTMQPAEIVKLALCIWMPNELINARKQVKKVGAPRAYSKLILGYLCAFCLVMSGKDLGTGLIILAIGGIALLLGGFPGKWLAGAALLGICGIVGFILTSPNRLGRIMAAYRTCSPSDLQGVCYQAVHGKYAIASGGLLGVGIGNSGEKWGYLPEAHNDFIFAIIGEETGFVGAAMVILLFIVMTWCMLMVAVQVRDRYITMGVGVHRGMDRRPGVCQHRRRRQPAAGHGRADAVRISRRIVSYHVSGGRRRGHQPDEGAAAGQSREPHTVIGSRHASCEASKRKVDEM